MNKTFDKDFNAALQAYAEKYDVDSLSSPNDQANLHTLIRNNLVLDQLQRKMHDVSIEDAMSGNIKKLNDSITDLIQSNLSLERQLNIDRKTRRQEQELSVVDYINNLKQRAKEFIEERYVRVMCKSCKIMVGRISGVYDTTYYKAEFKCPQCNKLTVVSRKEKDIFFDVKDADWRRKYPIEIVQAKRAKVESDTLEEDELVLSGDDILYEEDENL